MCFSLSQTRLYRTMRLSGTLLQILVYALATAVLGACYGVAKANGHLSTWPGLPPISALGDDYPEHIIFAVGFSLISVGLSLVTFLRHAQIESKMPRNVCNNFFFTAILLFFPPLIVAAAIPTQAWGPGETQM
jgi:hypothetical protein